MLTDQTNTLPDRQRWRGFTFYFDRREGNFALYRQKGDLAFIIFRVIQFPACTVGGVNHPRSEVLDMAESYNPDFCVYSTEDDALAALAQLAAGAARPDPIATASERHPKLTKAQFWAGVKTQLQELQKQKERNDGK